MPLAEDFQLPGFQTVKTLGKGGTAAIYLVRRQSDNRLLAAKTHLPGNPDPGEKFTCLITREYSLTADYRFPGLVRLHRIISDSSRNPALIMEYCSGKILEELAFPLEPELLADILSAIAIDLYFLKIIGLYHGDLKPGNIFLPPEFGKGSIGRKFHLKLFDFSLALRATEQSNQRLGLGTVGYMAPETIDTGHLDHRSDIFSLGVIAYKMATGRNPFSDEEHDPMRISARVKEYDPPPPSRFNKALGPDWDNLLIRMLSKDAAQRPNDGFEICQSLAKLGAAYPYYSIIRPKYVLEHYTKVIPADILDSPPFQIEGKYRERILDLAGEENNRLRLVMESHFSQGLLSWREGKLVCSEGDKKLPRPRYLLKRDAAAFRGLDRRNKKIAVKCAVIGDINDCRILGLIPNDSRVIDRPLVAFLKNRLSAVTNRKRALNLARLALKTPGAEKITARLFLQAENLEEGFSAIMDTVQILINTDQPEPACRFLEQLDALCEKLDDWSRRCLALMTWGDTLKKIGEAAQGEEIYRRLINLYEGRPVDSLLAEAYKDLGDIYKMKQDTEAGKESLKKAMDIYSSLGNQLELSHVMNNMGNLLSLNGEHFAAFKYYRDALKIQKRLNAPEDVASTINNMTRYYIFRGRLDRVKRIQKLALKINRRVGNGLEAARCLNNLGYVYFEFGDYENAIRNIQESLKLNRRAGIKGELIINLENLAASYQGAGFLPEAKKTANEGIELAGELEYKAALASLLNIISVTLKRQGLLGQAWKNIDPIDRIMEQIDDPEMKIAVGINKADLLLRFNRPEEARHILTQLLLAGEQTGNRKSVAMAYAVLARINDDQILLDKAHAIFQEIKSNRDTVLADLIRLSTALSQGDENRADMFASSIRYFFNTPNPDLEKAKAGVLLGEYSLLKGNIETATDYFEKSLEMAERRELRPEICEASYGLARLHTMGKDYEKAYDMYRVAMEAVKEQAKDIDDEKNRNGFLNSKLYQELAEETKKLKVILSKKSGAGR